MQTNYNSHSLKSGIYQIRNLTNERIYIGSAKGFKQRFNQHLNSLKKGTHHNKFLQADFNKCGSEAFIFEVLEVTEGTTEERRQIEQSHIDIHFGANCYNHRKDTVKTEGPWSYSPEETSKIISENSKRLWKDPKQREKMIKSMKKTYSTDEFKKHRSKLTKELWSNPEYREKILSVHLGAKRSEQACKNIGESCLKTYTFINPEGISVTTANLKQFCVENNLNYFCMSKLSKRKAWQHKGWKSPVPPDKPDYKEAQANRMRERWSNPEYKAKQRALTKDMWKDPEHKKKILQVLRDPKNSIKRRKTYIFLNPQNKEVVIVGMQEFCLNNNLSMDCMYNLVRGKGNQHKGWKFVSKSS